MMKIYTVTFNNGGWYSGARPNFTVVADSKQEAIDRVLNENPSYRKGYDAWASDQWKREEKLNNLLNTQTNLLSL